MITPIEISLSSVPGQIKVVRVAATARKQLVFKLTDAEGKAINLKDEVPNPPAPPPTFNDEPAARGGNVTIRLKASVGQPATGDGLLDIEGTILDQTEHTGFVSFDLMPQFTIYPGIYEANIGRLAANILVDAWPIFLLIEPNAFGAAVGDGPLTIPEVRLALYDVTDGTDGAPFSNLLDDTEFKDVDIIYAMRRVVDRWNETPPRVALYTPFTFPYRYYWTLGTCAMLLRMAAARYRRNRLDYQAGGVAINDQSKADEYQRIADAKMAEFQQWMMNEKVRMNMTLAWGTGL